MAQSSGTSASRALGSVGLAVFFLFSPHLFATASQNVPSGNGSYSVVDKLEALGCAYPTFRSLGPQSFFDIRSAIDLPSEKVCNAPEWLLDERQLLLRPLWMPEFRSDGFVGPDDRLDLRGLSASLWPLFPLRQNRPTVNGVNLSNEIALSMRTGTEEWGYALSVTPGFYAGYDIRGVLLGRFYLQEGYAKISYGFSELTVGRYARRFGEARHGTLLYSGAAAPLDVIEYTLRPIVPGGGGAFLGPVSFRTWIGSQGGDDIAVPGTALWGIEFGLRPLSWWEIAFAELVQFGGAGSPAASVGDYLSFPLGFGASADRNISLALTTSVWFPRHWAKVYGQVLANQVGDGGAPSASFLVGLWAPKLGKWDFRVEYARTSAGAYQHPFWTQGLTFRGAPLGHPLGSDGEGAYFDIGLPPLFTWWHSEIGAIYEARGISLAGTQVPEQRYGVSLSTGRRFGYSDIEARAVYHQVHGAQYVPGQIADVFGVGALYRYSF